jgi:hypothetical protein
VQCVFRGGPYKIPTVAAARVLLSPLVATSDGAQLPIRPLVDVDHCAISSGTRDYVVTGARHHVSLARDRAENGKGYGRSPCGLLQVSPPDGFGELTASDIGACGGVVEHHWASGDDDTRGT